jgi:type III pantothenate kinase
MLLAIDIGNSNIVLGIFRDGAWHESFRYETRDLQPTQFYEVSVMNLLLEWDISVQSLTKCVLSSVVPEMNDTIIQAVTHVLGYSPFVINPEVIKKMPYPIPYPYEIGADIVANTFAGLHLYGPQCIIVDFGTALTFTVADLKQGITGVTIAPGIKTALHALATNTSQLPLVPVELPDSAIGHDTISAIQAGVMWGYVGLVKELLAKIRNELPKGYITVATGGLSSKLYPLQAEFDHTNILLTLDGMRLMYNFHHQISEDKGK